MSELNQKAQVNGITLVFNRYGKGNAKRIMLIHGWTGFKELFKDFAPKLVENGCDVVIPDLRGHGDSDKPQGDYSHEVFSKDLYEFAKFLGWEKGFIMLGQSMGGYVCLDYALRYPETLTHVIPSNTSVYLARTFLSKLVWKMIIRMYKKDPAKMMPKMVPKFFQYPQPQEMIDNFNKMSLKTAKNAGLSAIMHSFNRNLEPELHNIKIPTLVISSEFDQKDLRQATLNIHKLIPNSKLVDIKRTGHLPFMENPTDFLQAIVNFIS